MARKIITWYYEQSPEEGGSYAQVRGDSASEKFRDVYRRCVTTFFATARREQPDAELILFTNRPWDTRPSAIARFSANAMSALGVRVNVLEYRSAPPETWRPQWRNQFYVLDVMKELCASSQPDDLVLIADSDIVWTDFRGAEAMWTAVESAGVLGLDLQYTPDANINGLSRKGLWEIERQLGRTERHTLPAYYGGEFLAFRADILVQTTRIATTLWEINKARHAEGIEHITEEAHLLSAAYRELPSVPGDAAPFIKRMWTQPFKHQNVERCDLGLPLWHVPAEKRYGLRRLYQLLENTNPDSAEALIAKLPPLEGLAKLLGVPANKPSKWVADVTSAVLAKLPVRA